MKKFIVGTIVLFSLFIATNIAYAATNQDALAGLIQTLEAIGKLADAMIKAYIEYLKA